MCAAKLIEVKVLQLLSRWLYSPPVFRTVWKYTGNRRRVFLLTKSRWISTIDLRVARETLRHRYAERRCARSTKKYLHTRRISCIGAQPPRDTTCLASVPSPEKERGETPTTSDNKLDRFPSRASRRIQRVVCTRGWDFARMFKDPRKERKSLRRSREVTRECWIELSLSLFSASSTNVFPTAREIALSVESQSHVNIWTEHVLSIKTKTSFLIERRMCWKTYWKKDINFYIRDCMSYDTLTWQIPRKMLLRFIANITILTPAGVKPNIFEEAATELPRVP